MKKEQGHQQKNQPFINQLFHTYSGRKGWGVKIPGRVKQSTEFMFLKACRSGVTD